MLQDRGALPKKEGDVVREYRALHEENFMSSWLRGDGVQGGKRKEGKQGDQRRGEQKEEKRRTPFSQNFFFSGQPSGRRSIN